jgi:hypothetical protein
VRSHDRHFRLTTQEIDDVVRALTMVAENLENDAARQSMQEAFAQGARLCRCDAGIRRESGRHSLQRSQINLIENGSFA